eukprot:3465839-Karenia_brevis.AAC.1
MTPGKRDGGGLHFRNVMNAIKDAGVNPFRVPLVIDFKATESFSTYRIAESPTLTKTRASAFGYWCTTKGGPLSANDMIKLQ